ncbi:alpha-D-ribose 1-methylphosphonate 5-triphosphate diphosphatase [Paenibacillus sp. CAU 1782]
MGALIVERDDRSSHSYLINNGLVVLENAVIRGAVVVQGSRISAVLDREEDEWMWKASHPESAVVDAGGGFILPGLIDIHCDAIEKEVQPRPGTLFPLELALLEFERKLPLHGITTMYHSLSLGVGLSLRGNHLLTGMVDLIHQYNNERAMIRNRIHLRFEVSHHEGLPIVEQYVEDGRIHYLSFMDHSPGQGQYYAPGSFQRYVMKNQGVTLDEVEPIVEELMERRAQIDWGKLARLGNAAVSKGIPVASHDDDSPSRVRAMKACGMSVSEFPINMETARYAAEKGISVCVGAPNVVRGGSHDNNLSAEEAVKAGTADLLCSDYHPSSLLASVFRLAGADYSDLPAAVKMATLNPAKVMGTDDDFGSLKAGKAADMIVVHFYRGMPWVSRTIVDGQCVYSSRTR